MKQFALSCCILLTLSAPAQEKRPLTFDQIYKNGEPRVLKQLPSISGWADDARYIETKRKEGDERPRSYAVDLKTGAETLYGDMDRYKGVVGEGIDPASPAASNAAKGVFVFQNKKDLYLLLGTTKTFRRLTESPATEEKNPTLSPDAAAVAFTRENDLYSIDLASGKETRHTTDGAELVYNGWASWIYYEEILGRSSRYRAFWWSTDSRRIAFFRSDDARVPEFPLYSSEGKHGFLERTRYPKVGDPNPEVRIGIVSTGATGPITWVDFDPKQDQYFGMPFWTPDGKELLVQWMNRGQDTLIVYGVNPATGAKRVVYLETQKSWVEWFEEVTFVGPKHDLILRSDRDGWAHLYRYGLDGKLRARLTSGPWAVEKVEGVNEKEDALYFTAKKEASTRTDLYRVRLDGSGLKRLTFGPYTHAVDLSPRGGHFITRYSNLSTPTRLAIVRNDGRVTKDLGDSKTAAFDSCRIVPTELVRVPTEDGYHLPMTITLPAVVEPGRRYPVIINVYGGPLAGTVTESWRGIGNQWMALEGAVQVAVDHRGSGHFGKAGASLMHRNLGKWEMADYITAVKWLREQPYVDSTRICITGGSYGGYVAAMALTYGAGYFTHGIASFSVVDWLLYDSHYTERYMDTKEENPDGYAFGSVLTHAGKYTGLLRIVHGTMDDNVHMQNSIQLVDRLQELGKHFELMIYPGGRHGWGGAKGLHSQTETNRFFYDHLLRKEYPAALFAGVRMGRRP